VSAHTVRPSRPARSSSAPRWPALVLIPALLIAAALVGRGDDAADAEVAAVEVQPEAYGPVVAGPDSLGAFWFCSGGTGVAGAAADHHVTAINTTDASRVVTLTVYGSRAADSEPPEPVTRQQTLTAYGRAQWRLGDLVAADYVSATVEIDGGGVVVERRVSGPQGAAAGPCSSTASPNWSVPVGGTDTTAANALRREILVFFNPFPADAVLDARFSTETGQRETDTFRGFVVPGRGVVAVDLSFANVTVSPEVTAEITARTGRVVVDRLQFYAEPEISGLALSTGVPTTSSSWVFPAGELGATRREALVVANPGDLPAEVDVEIRPEAGTLTAEPFELTVQPHRHVLLDLAAEERMQQLLAEQASFSIVVRTADGTSVAAERLVWVTPGQPGAGAATSPGIALAGTTLVADMAGAQPGSLLTLFNPSADSVAQVGVSILADGAPRPPVGDDEIEIQPGQRLTIPVEDLATGDFAVLLRSTTPVMAERDVVLAVDRYLAPAVVDAPSAQVIDLTVFGDVAE
jgi:hypothetical protein